MKKILYHSGWQKCLLFIISFSFYANSIPNDYALDDIVVITQNQFVKKGFGGITGILTHDSFYGATGTIAKGGGRYRTLSLIAFAIEKEFFGMNPAVFHFFSVLWYALLCLLIHHFLIRHVFKENYPAAFAAALLFAIHPVHTEVVANIKSSDEIFSLIFLIASLHFLMKYLQSMKRMDILWSLITFFLSLLSKENGVIFFVMIPVTLFVFSGFKLTKIISTSFLYWVVLSVYLLIRYAVSKSSGFEINNIMDNPYLEATTIQKVATISWVFGKYLHLLFYPDVLSYDYGYNQIPYVTFSDWQAVISLILFAGLLVYGIIGGLRKKRISYWILFFLASLFLVSNAPANIGTPLADRFLFEPGLFFFIAMVIAVQELLQRIKVRPSQVAVPLILIITVISFFRVHARNEDWKNNLTLYFKDIQAVPNSARAQIFCGMELVTAGDGVQDSLQSIEYMKEANLFFRRAYAIYPDFTVMYQNWGSAYFKLNDIDSATWVWNRFKKIKPDSRLNQVNDELLNNYYYNQHINEFNEAKKNLNYPAMLAAINGAIKLRDNSPDLWLLLGKLYQLNNLSDSAAIAWKKCLLLQPGNAEATGLIKRYAK